MENENGSIVRIFVNGQESILNEELQLRYLNLIRLMEEKLNVNYFEIWEDEEGYKFVAKVL